MKNTWFIERKLRKIYSIDESKVNQDLIKTLLSKLGYQTIGLNSLQSLLEVLENDSRETEKQAQGLESQLLEGNISDDSMRTFLRDLLSISSWFSYLLNQSAIGFCIISRNKYLMYNNYFGRMIQHHRDEMLKLTPGDTVLIHHRKKIRGMIRDMLVGKTYHSSADFEIVTGSKEIMHVRALGFQRKIQGQPLGIIFFYPKSHGSKHPLNIKEQIIHEMYNQLDRMIISLGPLQDHQALTTSAENNTVLNPENMPFNLTNREQEILKLIAQGYSTPEIASKLFISRRTVEFHRSNLLGKTHTRNTADLVRLALQKNLVNYE
jgi:DNA-binding CsgD family transcriptional regulator